VILTAGSQRLATSGDANTASATFEASTGATNRTKTPKITDSVSETETASSANGLGDAIMSGIGGRVADDGSSDSTTQDSQSSTDIESASHAARRSVHVMIVCFCTFAFAFSFAFL